MEIIQNINWDWILGKLLFFFVVFVYYKLILKMYCSHLFNDFEEKYCKKIKNRNLYFFLLLFYNFFLTLFFPLILSGVAMLDGTIKNIVNWDMVIIIITFLYCLKKAFLMMDNYNKTHWL